MYDIEFCKKKLELWLKVEEEVAIGGQSYEIDGRKLTRVDIAEIRAQIKLWESRLANASGNSGINLSQANIY